MFSNRTNKYLRTFFLFLEECLPLKHGTTRITILVGKYALKIATPSNHSHFLQGCANNWKERSFYKNFKECYLFDNHTDLTQKVAPSYYCSAFGLFQIQARCSPKLTDLTKVQQKQFKSLCGGDLKKENFGYYNGKLVCLDYA